MKICGRKPKLTAEQQAEIRTWLATRRTRKQLARDLGISGHTLTAYINGKQKQPVRAA